MSNPYPRNDSWLAAHWAAAPFNGTPLGAIFFCPACGGCLLGNSEHTISDTGDVTPALACEREACDWSDTIRLAGWREYQDELALEAEVERLTQEEAHETPTV